MKNRFGMSRENKRYICFLKLRKPCQHQIQDTIHKNVRWDTKFLVHYEIMAHRRSITVDVYCQQCFQLNESLCQNCPVLINRKSATLQYNNTPLCKINQIKTKSSGIRMEYSFTSTILTWFSNLRVSFVSIIRTFHNCLGNSETKKKLKTFFQTFFFKLWTEMLLSCRAVVVKNEGFYIFDK